MTFIKLVPSLEEISLTNLVKIDAKFVQYGTKRAVIITLNEGLDNEYIIVESDLTQIINKGYHPFDTTREIDRVRGYGCFRKVLDEHGFRNFHDLSLFAEIYRSEFIQSEILESTKSGYTYPNHQIELETYYEQMSAYYTELENEWNEEAEFVELEDEKRYRETYELEYQ